jgi:hypothetical protein
VARSKRKPKRDWRSYTADYAAKRTREGEKRVALWVPESRVDEIKALAQKMRAEEMLKRKKTSPTPRLVIPRVDIPKVPPPGWAHLRVEQDERGLHKMLTANGGEWSPPNRAWVIRSDLVEKLGMENRVIRIVSP